VHIGDIVYQLAVDVREGEEAEELFEVLLVLCEELIRMHLLHGGLRERSGATRGENKYIYRWKKKKNRELKDKERDGWSDSSYFDGSRSGFGRSDLVLRELRLKRNDTDTLKQQTKKQALASETQRDPYPLGLHGDGRLVVEEIVDGALGGPVALLQRDQGEDLRNAGHFDHSLHGRLLLLSACSAREESLHSQKLAHSQSQPQVQPQVLVFVLVQVQVLVLTGTDSRNIVLGSWA
jgi:hypothetical protein